MRRLGCPSPLARSLRPFNPFNSSYTPTFRPWQSPINARYKIEDMARSAGVVGSEVQYILVDDGSPGAPLLDIYLKETGGRGLGANVLILRIAENIAWNQVHSPH